MFKKDFYDEYIRMKYSLLLLRHLKGLLVSMLSMIQNWSCTDTEASKKPYECLNFKQRVKIQDFSLSKFLIHRKKNCF